MLKIESVKLKMARKKINKSKNKYIFLVLII